MTSDIQNLWGTEVKNPQQTTVSVSKDKSFNQFLELNATRLCTHDNLKNFIIVASFLTSLYKGWDNSNIKDNETFLQSFNIKIFNSYHPIFVSESKETILYSKNISQCPKNN
jgi:hypothetical protein